MSSPRKNKVVAGLAAGFAAILLAGGTSAYWSQATDVAGGQITSGNLQIAAGTVAWTDITDDLVGGGQPVAIDLADFRIVPGDTIQGDFGLKGALEGDNMIGRVDLALDGVPVTGDLFDGLNITYSLLDAAGDPMVGAIDVALGTDSAVKFVSADFAATNTAPADSGVLPIVLPATDNLTVQITVEFDPATADRDLVQSVADLGDLEVSLTQVRA